MVCKNKLFLVLSVLFFSVNVFGKVHTEAPVKDPETKQIVHVVVDTTEKLLKLLNQYKKNGKREEFYSQVKAILDKKIAFDDIAIFVMGRYSRRVNQDEIDQFLKVFKTSFVSYYTNILQNYDTGNIQISRTIPPHKQEIHLYKEKKKNSVPVDLQLSSGAKVYKAIYYVMKKNDTWIIKNITFEGINLAFQFQGQFMDAVSTYKTPQKVIKNWQKILESDAYTTEKGSISLHSHNHHEG